MALGNCVSCGGMVSAAAPTCPHCGQPSPIGLGAEPQSPFRPPRHDVQPSLPASDSVALRAIAEAQKSVLWCILGGIGSGIAVAVMKDSGMALIAILAYVGVGIASMVFMYRLASALHGSGVAVILTLLMFVPCVSLIVLVVVNSQATSRLTAAGIPVGVMGADMTRLPT